MAISFMNYHPDTCKCIIEQTHNPTDPAYGIQFSRVISKCTIHQAVPDDQLNGVIHSNPASDQKRKNLLEKYLLETGVALDISDATINPDGSTTYSWKSGISYNWSFVGGDENRVLNISIIGKDLNGVAKATIQTYCNSTFGAGRIVIN
jgi:hypothetical protein